MASSASGRVDGSTQVACAPFWGAFIFLYHHANTFPPSSRPFVHTCSMYLIFPTRITIPRHGNWETLPGRADTLDRAGRGFVEGHAAIYRRRYFSAVANRHPLTCDYLRAINAWHQVVLLRGTSFSSSDCGVICRPSYAPMLHTSPRAPMDPAKSMASSAKPIKATCSSVALLNQWRAALGGPDGAYVR